MYVGIGPEGARLPNVVGKKVVAHSLVHVTLYRVRMFSIYCHHCFKIWKNAHVVQFNSLSTLPFV